MDPRIFNKLCAAFGLETEWTAGEAEKPATVPPAMQREVLAALGLDTVLDDRGADQLLAGLEQKKWQQLVSPVTVVEENVLPLRFELRLEAELPSTPLHWTITEEGGAVHEGEILLSEAATVAKKEINARQYVALELTLSIALPCGYHNFTVTGAARAGKELQGTCTLIIVPASCYIPPGLEQQARIFGISCSLNAIRSRRNWGIGDFSDLRNILEQGAENGAGAVALNPLQPLTHTASTPFRAALISSLRFLDPLYLDPEAVADYWENDEAREFVRDPAFQVRLAALRDNRYVDFKEIDALKTSLFTLLWDFFRRNHLNPETDKGRQFRRFQQDGGQELYAWSTYAALQDSFSTPDKTPAGWVEWPEPFRNPQAGAVEEFSRTHQEQLEFHQYLQWQAELQLAAIGRRSMELGLKVGLVESLPDAVAVSGFETWHGRRFFAINMRTPSSSDGCGTGDEGGGPPLLPQELAQAAYAPLIAALRTIMRYAGGLRIGAGLMQEWLRWTPRDITASEGILVRYPVADLLGIIALESQRNRCLVICEQADGLGADFLNTLMRKGFFLWQPVPFEKSDTGEWLTPSQYTEQAVVAVSAFRAVSLAGFWDGADICSLAGPTLAVDTLRREKAIVARAADRAHLLIALNREGLLPQGYGLDPAMVPRMTPALANGVHLFLARTAARLFLVDMADLPCLLDLAEHDEGEGEPELWLRKLEEDIEVLLEDECVKGLLTALLRERDIGVVRPSAVRRDRHEKVAAAIPAAFYRIQFNSRFTFGQAAEVVGYLQELGISHVYASPYLKARPGSRHGYDIIDHAVLNPEIGSREDYERFVAALDRHNMAQILDMVPNHMGAGPDNTWWVDVLENGPSSVFADFFDINWQTQQEGPKARILLPVLDDYYGSVLENGRLQLAFIPEAGSFAITFYEQRYPVAPRTYPFILGRDLARLEDRLGSRHEGFLELQNLISSFSGLPDRRETEPERIEMRHRNKEVLKRLLARLCREVPQAAVFIEENVILINGEVGRPESFDLLHELLGQQAYRLAFWRVASDEINYRRFFDINDLAAIRAENPRVFEATHRFVLDLIATGKIDGLRIDHPDGLYDPDQYYRRLQAAVRGEPLDGKFIPSSGGKDVRQFPLYVVVEKILADREHLPADWQVHGTTGYDFAILVNGLFVDPSAEKVLTSIYRQFTGRNIDFTELLYDCKKLIIETAMSGELYVLAGELHRLTKRNRYTQDYTLNTISKALIEIVAFFPVYRTYIKQGQVSDNDRFHIESAINRARARQRAEDVAIYDFVRDVLLLKFGKDKDDSFQAAVADFVMKLQQYTGPIMAKGLEDTSFYIYNRLVGLNEVGGDPRRFGMTPDAFHQSNLERSRVWPHAMLTTSTHDSKRSEDVRARINVLSELADEWRSRLGRWSALNRRHKTKTAEGLIPSKNDEYALYQNLLGVWPLEVTNGEAGKNLAERFEAFMLKAIREAKVHTSWINQNVIYEEATTKFVKRILAEGRNNFLPEFLPFQKKISWFGLLNSLAQLLLKLTAPGVPDTFQGNEIWCFRLVDPDNRQPVDFGKRRKMLAELKQFLAVEPEHLPGRVRELCDTMADGRVKMYVLWSTLQYRQRHKELFKNGGYQPLAASGAQENHICVYARMQKGEKMIVAVPRLMAGLLGRQTGHLPLGPEVWKDTAVVLSPDLRCLAFRNILTGERICATGPHGDQLQAATLFASFPLALLEAEENSEDPEKHHD